MSDWIKDSSIDHLRKIRGSRSTNSLEHRAADEEIRRREAEDAKKASLEREALARKRHDELVASQKDSKNHSQDNWYKKIIIGVIIGAVVLLLKYAFGL